jgi:anaerobic magnesium-protoporphyrin IX monomethyl ester cyclase
VRSQNQISNPAMARDRARFRILVIFPPQVLSYFNAGHRLALYQVTDHLRSNLEDASVDVLDAPVANVGWKDLADQLYAGDYHAAVVMNDLDGIEGFERFCCYARELCSGIKIATYGRLSGMNPGYFRRFDIDAIVETGDFETGVLAAISWFRGQASAAPGVATRAGERWQDPISAGTSLPPSEWSLPSGDEIPYDHYDELYRRDARKYPGLPNRRELVVPIARGCPVKCAFCEVPVVFGAKERRISVDLVVDYIQRSFADSPFAYVSFYAPTFTLNRPWVLDLTARLEALGARYPWKCCTTMHHLDQELVDRMGRSGCVRISVGVETLETSAYPGLPKMKRKGNPDLAALAAWCSAAGVELNCFVVIGLPGTTIKGARDTIAFARSVGARVRPTAYTPYEVMTADMSSEQMSALNRQILSHSPRSWSGEDRRSAYEQMFGDVAERTSASDRVPPHRLPT